MFRKDNVFSYRLFQKRLFAFSFFGVLGLVLLLIAYYLLFLQDADFFVLDALRSLISHMISQIRAATLLGVFYSSSIGGLFFVIMSMEGLFITFLDAGHDPWLLILVYLSGLVLSYSVNYLLGAHLAEFSKRLITPKKFYRIKGLISRYGVLAIFVFNVLPLPSQPLAAILGVFKYSKPRFYTFFILGQFVKYLAIVFGYIYIFS